MNGFDWFDGFKLEDPGGGVLGTATNAGLGVRASRMVFYRIMYQVFYIKFQLQNHVLSYKLAVQKYKPNFSKLTVQCMYNVSLAVLYLPLLLPSLP